MKKISVLLLTIDRYYITQKYIGKALREAGYPFELCITDNGSKEKEIFEWCEQQNPKLYLKNEINFGTAQSLNKMVALNPSDYYVFIGNDIELPKNWLKSFVEYAEEIPESGIIGIDWRDKEQEYELRVINSKPIRIGNPVFGDMFFSQKLMDKIGSFCEDYGVYGLWDSDTSHRSKIAGFVNYYIPGLKSHHHANDVGENSDYRRMKDESLKKARSIFDANIKRYNETKQIFIPNGNN